MTIDTFKITKTTWVEDPTGTSVVYYSGWKQGMNARIGKVLKTNKNVTTIKRIYRKDKIQNNLTGNLFNVILYVQKGYNK